MQTQVNKNLFNGQTFYVGIDCHKKSWKVTILSEHYEHKTISQNPDPDLLAGYLKRNFPGGNYQAVYEAGFSGFDACRRLKQLGVDCKVIHPADVPTNQKERVQKTDKADSRKLARSLRNQEFESIHIPDRKLEADRALVRQRFRLMRDLSRTKNRVKSLLFQFGINIPEQFTLAQMRHWSKPYINWLKDLYVEEESLRATLDNYIHAGEQQRKQLLHVNRQIRKLARSDAYRDNYHLLLTVPGVGIITAMTLLIQIGDIRRFKRLDELCNYVGLVPSMHGSGEKMETGKMIKRGRKELKIMLIEAAWVAARKDPALMVKFNELMSKMNKNKAIIRIARKLLNRIKFVLIHQQPYAMNVIK
ncbi:MAG: IS110 family transposase [Bacteroidales bacterium]